MFEVETEEAIYEVSFIHAQINITSRCNMRCEHCRGGYEGHVDLSVADFNNILAFASQNIGEGGGYLISGGEPLMHPDLRNMANSLRNRLLGKEFVSLTTNGTYLNNDWLDFFQNLEFPDFRVSVSLDSPNANRHNSFRHCWTAFEGSVRAIGLAAARPGVKCIVRATIQKDQISEMESLFELVDSLGADILSVSSVIPVGRAIGRPEFEFGRDAKKRLIELAEELNSRGRRLKIEINDPLAYISNGQQINCGEFGGCIAGIGTFSVEPEGVMLPCPVLPDYVIMNVKGMTPDQMLETYSKNQFIRELFERKFSGKCSGCDFRFSCGGCRARAEGKFGNYLAEDPDCWL